jgi:hypothetical protein
MATAVGTENKGGLSGALDGVKSWGKGQARGIVLFIDRNFKSRISQVVLFGIVIPAMLGLVVGSSGGFQSFGANLSFHSMSADPRTILGYLSSVAMIGVASVSLGVACYALYGNNEKEKTTTDKVLSVAFPLLVVGAVAGLLTANLHQLKDLKGAVSPELYSGVKTATIVTAALMITPVLIAPALSAFLSVSEREGIEVKHEELMEMMEASRKEGSRRHEHALQCARAAEAKV